MVVLWLSSACDEPLDAASVRTAVAAARQDLPAAFAITGPAAVNVTATPTVTWEESRGAASYRVWSSAKADCTQGVEAAVEATKTSWVPETLADGVHYACVTAINDAGVTKAKNHGAAFRVKATPPSGFAIKGPASPTNVRAPLVTWEAAAGATSYRLTVGSPTCSPALQTHTVTSTEKALDELADGDYAICVTAIDEAGNTTAASNDALPLKVKASAPGAFVLTGPASPTIQRTPIITWEASTTAVSYRLTIGSPACSPALQTHTVTTTEKSLETLADGDYAVCVTAIDDAGNTTTATNDAYPLKVKASPPGAFTIKGPASPTNQRTPRVTWEAATTAASYRLTVGSPTCSPALQTHTVTTTEKALDTLVDGDYAVCVTAIDIAGNATAAANDTYPLTIKGNPPGSFDITGPTAPVGPTPTVSWQSSTGAATYDLVLASDAACDVKVRSHLGLATTSHNEASLSAGTYYVCVTAKDALGNARKAGNDGYSFTINPPPQVIGVSPVRGHRFGGVTLTVTGNDFDAAATVTVGGATCNDLVVASATTLTCVVPPHAVGAVDVVVNHSDGQSYTLAGAFTYVSFLYVTNYDSNSISGYIVNPVDGELTAMTGSPFAAGANPGPIAKDPKGRFLYVSNLGNHTVSGFVINPATGELTRTPGGDLSSGGSTPTGGAIDPQGKRLYVPNFWSNSMAIYDIDADTGELAHISGSPFGSCPNTQNPLFDPSGDYLYLPAAGNNTICLYGVDQTSGTMSLLSSYGTSGNPTQAVRHPSGSFLYVSNAFGNDVTAYNIDSSTLALSAMAGSPYSSGGDFAGALTMTPNGSFVYAINYNSDTIAAFSVDATTGALTAVSGSPFATGAHPGDLAVDTTGKFLYVHNDYLNRVVGYTIDPTTGVLTPMPTTFPTGNNPASLAMF